MQKYQYLRSCTITFIHRKNYGAFLQSWALQQFLGKLNCILQFIPSYHYYVGEKGRRKLPFFWRFVALWRHSRVKNFHEHRSMLRLSRRYSRPEDVAKKPPEADVYITGSDQVWNHAFVELRKQIYFLVFGSPDVKRISYAASIGAKEWPKEFEQKVLPWLEKFHAISVREESSVEYLTNLGCKNVVCVCDPTILHKADFYREEFNMKTNRKGSDEKFVFNYFLREKIPAISGMKTITVNLNNKKNIVSVSEWLSLIDNSEFVQTDSFHCVVFSILFHKPFAVFQNNNELKGMNERFKTVLGKTNLEYRLLQGHETEEQILRIVNREIDWEQVNSVLEEWRIHSANWLCDALTDT